MLPSSSTRKPKAKKCRNPECCAKFVPLRPFQQACSIGCSIVVGRLRSDKIEKAAEKVRRAQDRAKREQLKPLAKLIAAAQKSFNAYIRERDKDRPCICCGRKATAVDGLGAHGWDCGHYRSTGSASHLRFNEDNAHRQLVFCNRHGAGRAVDYRIGLIARIGLERVEALEADSTPKKWTREELIAIKKTYAEKTKQLKQEAA